MIHMMSIKSPPNTEDIEKCLRSLSRSTGVIECRTMPISFSDRVKIPDDVLISKLQEESVILNLDSERYYGLDDVGTRFLSVLATSESIETAYQTLLEEYDIEGPVLRQDLLELVQSLANQGIVEICGRSL